jgi:hypothetical protein
VPLSDAPRRFDAADARHPQVHEHDVGLETLDEHDGGLAVTGGADHLDTGERAEQGLETLAHRGLVVHDDDPHVGTVTWTTHPQEPGPACTAPPSGSMRSRIPRRP